MTNLKKPFFIILGTICVFLAILGMFVPLLPTTGFLLLAAYFYSRSSDRYYQWLMTNRWFGDYLRNYREGRGIPLKQKIITLVVLWGTIGLTAWFAVSLWWVRLLLLAVATGVTWHVLTIKTYKSTSSVPESDRIG